MVVNAPTSNITSAAEHTIALILATARNVAQAHSALKDGEWKRSKYTGVELDEKVVGILGLGKIGQLVAQRLQPFGVELIAYDPYLQPARAAQMGVRLVSLEEVLRAGRLHHRAPAQVQGDLGLIGDRELHQVKPSVRIINVARGGIIDENALYSAIKEGRVAGAGIDVFPKEPVHRQPAVRAGPGRRHPAPGRLHPRGPGEGRHPGRAQRQARARRRVRAGRGQRPGRRVAEDVKPGLPLAEKLGRVFTALAGEVATRLDVEVRGEIAAHDVRVLELAALKGVFTDVVEDSVTYVNAPLLAKDRGVDGRAGHQRRTAPTGATSSPSAASLADGRTRLGLGHAVRRRARSRRSSRSTATQMEIEPTDAPVVLHLHRPPRHRRRRRPDPRRRTASTSPRCRWPGTRRAARRSSR